jgi:endonuclease/exonuclease/phosphatase family metal-dependent hydrolase
VTRGASRAVVVGALLALAACAPQPAAAPPVAPVATAPAAPAAPAADLRIMTWNVKTNEFDPPDWAPVVAAQAPDVVTFQEICAGDAQRLADLLRTEHGLDYQVATGAAREPLYETCPPSASAPLEFGQAVLSRVPLRDPVTTPLPDPGGLDEPRAYLAVTLDLPGGPVRLLTTHITIGRDTGDTAAKSARRRELQGQQIAAVARAAAGAGGRVVLTGDFNVGPDDPRLDPVEQAGLQEVDRGRNAFTGGNDPRTPDAPADAKIDYIFLAGIAQVGTPQAPWVTGSDHRPLIATVHS